MHGLVGVLEQTVGRNKDHLALRALFQHGAGCIQTVHTGHLNVHQDQVCTPQHCRIRCLAPVPVLHHPRSTDESFLKLLLIFHQWQIQHHRRTASRMGPYHKAAVPIQQTQAGRNIINADMLPAFTGLAERPAQLS